MRILLAACLILTGTSAGLACGNPLLWAMLFAKVPEAKVVYEAELAARADGLITARVYDARPGEAYHLWSKAWIMDLAKEMQPTVENRLEPGQSLTILLADEVAAVRFSREAGVEFVPAAGLGRIARYDLITSTNALKSVWRDGLSYEEMLTFDLARTQENKSDQFLKAFF
ncbi:hypothetical protein [Roseibium sp. MMSF_3412]|uniref:hypothetical protein n=1 Tax=Roseibium sp. MMSF_3412 TaxID=3046712 RepID=UPI00273F777A|nr:hypothetical protein [Roseibium sp. MMSF_3412]